MAIEAHDLGKSYRVAAAHKVGRSGKEDFWALRDVSFDVPCGQVLGIVGRNGAGKSTLLKILSRITSPTTGRVILNGQVGALLEVGTGFHPELTGRDNVYLNGTLMGMTRREVRHRFDEIVEFAGVEYFLDTPVKRYSSGMYVRLAFAVAAHLSNDILILDEVLAVGDAAFQRKCLGKMRELASGEGRTVLLVSHNADVIRRQAERALRLDRGRLVLDSTVERVLEDYERFDVPHIADVEDADRADGNWGRLVRILRVEVLGGGTLPMGRDLVYEVTLRSTRDLDLGVGQAVITLDDRPIATSFSALTPVAAGTRTLRVRVPTQSLAPGRYSLNVVVGQSSFAAPDLHYDGVMHPVTFEVLHSEADQLVDWHPEWWGAIALDETQVELVD